MTRRFLISCGCLSLVTIFLAFPLAMPGLSAASVGKDFLSGYPAPVRSQAERVGAVARAGREAELAKEVRLLRVRMHETGILSINAFPDLVFERAVREGWKKDAAPVLRILREVSPFSVPMWAWLAKEDIISGRLQEFLQDLEGMAGATRRFGPALLGYASWLFTFMTAAGCWFALWGSSILFLRARPSLEGDLLRALDIPYRESVAPVLLALIFLLPVAAGFGLAVAACIWLLLSVAYLRRGELVLLTAVVLVLVGLVLAGGILHSLRTFGDEARVGWLGGEGNLSFARSNKGSAAGMVFLPGGTFSWMQRFERARLEMQSGDPAAAEKRWNSLIDDGRDLQEVVNNRGVARAQMGKVREALDDFESAAVKHPGDPSALWNAYQAHLQLFNLDRARLIQPEAWDRIQRLPPFFHRPADMEQGEWIASPLPVREIWKVVFRLREDWIRDAGESDMFLSFFRPLSASGAVVFLAAVLLFSSAWNLLSRKLWVHSTCRSCGSRSLVVRSREASDLCGPCRVNLGGGIRMGKERTRRVQGIVLHRRYVRLASLAVPGAGALWSGKEIRVLVFGMMFSTALAAVTCSLGGLRAGGPLVADLQRTVSVWGVVATAVLWAGGAVWGIRSFTILQQNRNVAGER
ncbi:MAG: tetratricopeptide repeat protein [Deltaproteobacteria bacterium]|nr:tetratricopeptide repeat protein [Deltaproteobacteria bacterium]